MSARRKPPLDFWLWLAVIGLVVLVAAVSIQFPTRIAPSTPAVSEPR